MTPADTSLQETIDVQEAEQRSALAASGRPYEAPKPVLPTCEATFSLSQPVLLQALTTVMKSVPVRRCYPDILYHVQVQVESDRILLRGTDLVTGIELVVPAQIERIGTFTINARTLLDCVKTFPKAGTVRVEVKDGQVHVASGKRTFMLKDATDGHDFPCLPLVQAASLVLPADVLRQAIKEVQFAAATDDSRPVFLAICMHVLPDSMNLVAIDGKRMAIRTLALPNVPERNEMVLIEADVWRLLCDVMPKDGTVSIAWDKERASWSVGTLRLVARLIEGNYPNYTVPFPKSHKTTFTVSRNDLASLLNAFRPFTRDSANILKLSYIAEGITFAARSDELGEVSEELRVPVNGEDGYALFDADYIADVLKNVATSEFTFAVSGFGYPCLMTPVGRNDCQALIMPLSCDRW